VTTSVNQHGLTPNSTSSTLILKRFQATDDHVTIVFFASELDAGKPWQVTVQFYSSFINSLIYSIALDLYQFYVSE